MNQKIEQYKNAFLKATNRSLETEVEIFSFGDTAEMADELGKLVLQGKKTGTSSGYDLYAKDETKPYKGQLSIVLDSEDSPICVIENINVETIPFNKVTKEHARKEGEGDLSLEYWKKAHLDFFPRYYKEELDIEFSENHRIIYEEFKVVFI
ncbi:ASCH domain-containing protein [Marinilactibacillus psychrotolerans]|nr:ASCH domain-containing protein [Marinilactibacillus psychrotolerans]TLQ08002.1 ASCH domain-containing protein [Marinilactibacillus psychrotolerans]